MRKNKPALLKVVNLENFDPIEYLVDEEAIASYLSDVRDAGNQELLKLAMQNIEQARLINSSKK